MASGYGIDAAGELGKKTNNSLIPRIKPSIIIIIITFILIVHSYQFDTVCDKTKNTISKYNQFRNSILITSHFLQQISSSRLFPCHGFYGSHLRLGHSSQGRRQRRCQRLCHLATGRWDGGLGFTVGFVVGFVDGYINGEKINLHKHKNLENNMSRWQIKSFETCLYLKNN